VDLDTFIVTTYCLIDDLLEDLLDGRRLRSRGPKPLLDDREVLTIEVVGEFLGMDTEKGIFSFFAGTTLSGSRPWAGCTAPPSPARLPTSGL